MITWRALVLRDEFAVFADGYRTDTAGRNLDMECDPGLLIANTGARFGDGLEGVLVWWPKFPVTDRDKFTDELLASAQARGWAATPQGKSSGWFTFHHRRQAVHLAIGPWLNQRKIPLLQLDDSQTTIADRLARFHVATGSAWRMTAGMTGSAMIRDQIERSSNANPLWRWDHAPQDIVGTSWEMRWQRPATKEEEGYPYVHCFDITAMYHAAAALTKLGHSAPVHRAGPVTFNRHTPGYWLVDYDSRMLEGHRPIPFYQVRRLDNMSRLWLTTESLALLVDNGIEPPVRDAWLAVSSSQHLKKWAERLRDARYSNTLSDLQPALKSTANTTIGALARPGGRIYRPDWRDLIVDKARANLIRKIIHASPHGWPMRVNVDAVWYASTDRHPTDLAQALGVREHSIGKFHYVNTVPTAEYLAKYQSALSTFHDNTNGAVDD